jgi:hypothetical protein
MAVLEKFVELRVRVHPKLLESLENAAENKYSKVTQLVPEILKTWVDDNKILCTDENATSTKKT